MLAYAHASEMLGKYAGFIRLERGSDGLGEGWKGESEGRVGGRDQPHLAHRSPPSRFPPFLAQLVASQAAQPITPGPPAKALVPTSDSQAQAVVGDNDSTPLEGFSGPVSPKGPMGPTLPLAAGSKGSFTIPNAPLVAGSKGSFTIPSAPNTGAAAGRGGGANVVGGGGGGGGGSFPLPGARGGGVGGSGGVGGGSFPLGGRGGGVDGGNGSHPAAAAAAGAEAGAAAPGSNPASARGEGQKEGKGKAASRPSSAAAATRGSLKTSATLIKTLGRTLREIAPLLDPSKDRDKDKDRDTGGEGSLIRKLSAALQGEGGAASIIVPPNSWEWQESYDEKVDIWQVGGRGRGAGAQVAAVGRRQGEAGGKIGY